MRISIWLASRIAPSGIAKRHVLKCSWSVSRTRKCTSARPTCTSGWKRARRSGRRVRTNTSQMEFDTWWNRRASRSGTSGSMKARDLLWPCSRLGDPLLRFAIPILIVVTIATLPAETPQSDPATFETVSIETSTNGLIDTAFTRRRFTARTSTLVELIEQAYDVPAASVLGGPPWLRSDRFTVRATAARDVTVDELKQMLRALLAERFQLQIERGAMTTTIYRLSATAATLKPTRTKEAQGIRKSVDEDTGYRWDGRDVTMGELAQALSNHLQAPVTDETNLTGRYDFRFDFFQAGTAADPNARTIFTALEEVGLALAAGSGEVSGYVIRHATRPLSD